MVRTGLLMGLGVFLALITGWLLAQSLRPNPQANALKRPLIKKETPRDQTRQRLVQLISSHPGDWRWRFLLARMKFQQGDREGAMRELMILQALWPNRPEIQDLKLLMVVGTESQTSALNQILEHFKKQPKGERLSLGLRLADLQRLTGNDKAAIATYRLLAAESPENMQPLLALALLHREKGQVQQSQKLLVNLRNRISISKKHKQDLDQIAVRWALESARVTHRVINQ